MVERTSSGIDTFDEYTGGIPAGSSTLVYGPPESGKSLFSYHFLLKAIQSGKGCIFIMTDYGEEDLLQAMKSFGWDVEEGIENDLVQLIVMSSSKSLKKDSSQGTIHIESLTELMIEVSKISRKFSKQDMEFCLILDSLTSLFDSHKSLLVVKMLRDLVNKMKEKGCVGMVFSHLQSSTKEGVEAMIKSNMDNVILLNGNTLTVEGMLNSPSTSMSYKITSDGIEVGNQK